MQRIFARLARTHGDRSKRYDRAQRNDPGCERQKTANGFSTAGFSPGRYHHESEHQDERKPDESEREGF
jgi:hypothetical protein